MCNLYSMMDLVPYAMTIPIIHGSLEKRGCFFFSPIDVQRFFVFSCFVKARVSNEF